MLESRPRVCHSSLSCQVSHGPLHKLRIQQAIIQNICFGNTLYPNILASPSLLALEALYHPLIPFLHNGFLGKMLTQQRALHHSNLCKTLSFKTLRVPLMSNKASATYAAGVTGVLRSLDVPLWRNSRTGEQESVGW